MSVFMLYFFAGSFSDGWICCWVGVSVLPVLGIRVVQSKTSGIIARILRVCACVYVCVRVCCTLGRIHIVLHKAVDLWENRASFNILDVAECSGS